MAVVAWWTDRPAAAVAKVVANWREEGDIFQLISIGRHRGTAHTATPHNGNKGDTGGYENTLHLLWLAGLSSTADLYCLRKSKVWNFIKNGVLWLLENPVKFWPDFSTYWCPICELQRINILHQAVNLNLSNLELKDDIFETPFRVHCA